MGRYNQRRRAGKPQAQPEAIWTLLQDFDPGNAVLYFENNRPGFKLRVEWNLVRNPTGPEAGVTVFDTPSSPMGPVYPTGNVEEGWCRVREELGQHVSVWSDWISGGI